MRVSAGVSALADSASASIDRTFAWLTAAGAGCAARLADARTGLADGSLSTADSWLGAADAAGVDLPVLPPVACADFGDFCTAGTAVLPRADA